MYQPVPFNISLNGCHNEQSHEEALLHEVLEILRLCNSEFQYRSITLQDTELRNTCRPGQPFRTNLYVAFTAFGRQGHLEKRAGHLKFVCTSVISCRRSHHKSALFSMPPFSPPILSRLCFSGHRL